MSDPDATALRRQAVDARADDIRNREELYGEIDRLSAELDRYRAAGDELTKRAAAVRSAQGYQILGSAIADYRRAVRVDATPKCELCGCDHQHNDWQVVQGPRGCVICKWCSGSPGVSRPVAPSRSGGDGRG